MSPDLLEKNTSSMEIDYEKKTVIIKVNTKRCPMVVLYSAAYIMLDIAHILFEGDPENEISVLMKAKNGCDLEKLGMNFEKELSSYNFYMTESEAAEFIRNIAAQRGVETNARNSAECECIQNLEEISRPWSAQKGKIENGDK